MLCYQYSRNVTDIIHDTFAWLRINRRIFRAAAFPLGALCVVATLFLSVKNTTYVSSNLFDTLWTNFIRCISPFSLQAEVSALVAAAVYGMLTLASALLMIPLIRRYLYNMQSLKNATLKMAVKGIDASAALAAMLLALDMVGWVLVNGFIMFCLMIPVTWMLLTIIPCLIMRQKVRVMFSPFFLTALNLALAWLFFNIVQAVPVFCITLIEMAISFIVELLPGLLSDSDSINSIYNYIDTFIMCVFYCIAVTALLVNIVIIHGSNYYSDK